VVHQELKLLYLLSEFCDFSDLVDAGVAHLLELLDWKRSLDDGLVRGLTGSHETRSKAQ
jgi:hypothetical protein